jgi:hypothetical protein
MVIHEDSQRSSKNRENSLYDTTCKYDFLYDTQNFFLPYMTLGVNFLPYMIL